jgi:hypothetical protein
MMLHAELGLSSDEKSPNQVDIEDMSPLLDTLIIERSIGRDTSTVHESIYVSNLVMDSLVELTNTLFFFDMTWECICTHSICPDIREGLLSLRYITTGGDDDIRSLRGESYCCSSTDSLRTSGDEDFFSGKTLLHRRLLREYIAEIYKGGDLMENQCEEYS